ncbi:C4-dicarboxylate transporter/malic acid transport protein [Aspergillus rambellii]|uniref:C4-dicarboxylate transporter/malic acid transport protein n=1 Tax=Aspergillus rambellii TaxID=308745 RepID=A0A0F8VEV1_9EURO|nr:C4-dicarboxylate transporter/malic acid transport protein [Aspergillus rambellii]
MQRDIKRPMSSGTQERNPDQRNLSKHEVGWRRVVRNFTPSWFAVTMGTGIVSVLLNTLPYNGIWLYWISVVIFALNVLLFFLALLVSILRYTLYPEIFKAMISHPVQSMFLGTFPMGFATIVNMFCNVCVPAWGEWARTLAWAMWIADAVVSVVIALSLPFLLMARKTETQLSSMTAVWLLPIVSCVVAASSGAVVAEVLPNPQHALWTIIVSYVLWGIGVPLAFMVMVIYLQRLTLHKLPPKAVIVSVFLPLGPLGQGGYGAMKLGKAAQTIFPQTNTLEASSGPTFYTLGFLVSLILWSFGLVWLFFASASIARCKTFPFNIGWWGFTFPLGVYALSTCQMGAELPSAFFRVLGTILSVCVVILWIVVSLGTLKGMIAGHIFHAPCLGDLKMREDDSDETKAV